MAMSDHRLPPDLFHLAHRHPLRPEVWELRYRTTHGERAVARLQLHAFELVARVRRGAHVAELRSRDPHALADLLNADREHLAAPFRRVR